MIVQRIKIKKKFILNRVGGGRQKALRAPLSPLGCHYPIKVSPHPLTLYHFFNFTILNFHGWNF